MYILLGRLGNHMQTITHLWLLVIIAIGISFFGSLLLIGDPCEIQEEINERHFIYELRPEIRKRKVIKNNMFSGTGTSSIPINAEVNQKKDDDHSEKPTIVLLEGNIVVPKTPSSLWKKRDFSKRGFKDRHSSSTKTGGEEYRDKINSVVYDPLEYQEPPIETIHYDSDGMLDTKKNRIDFSKPNWYAQFQYYRELLSKQSPYDVEPLVNESNGESDAVLTPSYGILSNACLTGSHMNIQLFGEKGQSIPDRVKKLFKINDFYFSSATTVDGKLSPEKFHSKGNHTAIFQPRSYTNIFHFLEGSSQLIRLALHPHHFPPISHVVISSQKSSNLQKWHGFLEYAYLDLFAASKRPIMHFSSVDNVFQGSRDFCDSSMTVFRNWDTDGSGNLIPDLLGVDMIRAAAYRRAGVIVNLEGKDKLYYLQVSRVNKRRILNEKEIYQSIIDRFSEELDSHFTVLEQESASMQVQRFAQLDILAAAHGAGLTNVIFMLPNSYLIELMPPFWDLACYKRLADNANVGYYMIRAVGKKGPECDKNHFSQLCRRKGIRDRDFNITISSMLNIVEKGMRFVRKHKYM